MRIEDSSRFIKGLILVAALVLMFPSYSNAYLDLGTGSYVLQIFLAAIFTWLIVMKRLWSSIIAFIKTRFFKAT